MVCWVRPILSSRADATQRGQRSITAKVQHNCRHTMIINCRREFQSDAGGANAYTIMMHDQRCTLCRVGMCLTTGMPPRLLPRQCEVRGDLMITAFLIRPTCQVCMNSTVKSQRSSIIHTPLCTIAGPLRPPLGPIFPAFLYTHGLVTDITPKQQFLRLGLPKLFFSIDSG